MAAAAADSKVPATAASAGTASASTNAALSATEQAFVAIRERVVNLSANPNFPTHDATSTLGAVSWDHGFITRPMLWSELAFLTDSARSGEHYLLLGRIKPALDAYKEHINRVKTEYVSIEDYVRHTKLGGAVKPNSDTDRRWRCDASTIPDQPKTVYVPNDFPYTVESGIGHDLIWSVPDALSAEQINTQMDKYRPNTERLTFVSSPALKSVPGVHHVHVFYRAKSTAAASAAAAVTKK